MGSFVFKWAHPASEVYVTGTFDDWKKTEKLEKVGEHFEKAVTLSDASEKIFYKFVVDGDWVTDHTAPKEIDESGNENNILTPERIIAEEPATAIIMNSITPESTTAALAAEVPLEKKKNEELPGTFPETPAAELDKAGDFSVNPLPATAGAVNPITLAPGEKIPEGLAAESTTSNVKLDPESYEKSDTLPGGAPALFSSAAPESTTAALAASAPLETKAPVVPEVVKESQEKAHVDPEASAVPAEVEEKAAVESELLEKVKEAPTTSEGTAGQGTEKTEKVVDASEAAASVAAAATALGGAAIAGAVAAKDIAVEKATDAATAAQTSATEAATNLPDSVKEKLPESVQNAIGGTTKEETREEVSPEVPAEVKESIAEAGKAPEAAANTEAVEDKKAVEAELLKEVKPVDADKEESKAKPAESTDAVVAESSEIRIPPAVESTPVNGTNGTNGVESVKPVEVKPAESTSVSPTTTTLAKGPEAAATSSSNKSTDGTTTTEKKKKNRLSGFFGKVKSKFNK
ncbi:carbohydrate-binding module family 48 protein [Hypoxylon sp. CI-4A]|nr:carbohydrate-binding module family 48 protein [Hypoxylon sp. CI-4A]